MVRLIILCIKHYIIIPWKRNRSKKHYIPKITDYYTYEGKEEQKVQFSYRENVPINYTSFSGVLGVEVTVTVEGKTYQRWYQYVSNSQRIQNIGILNLGKSLCEIGNEIIEDAESDFTT